MKIAAPLLLPSLLLLIVPGPARAREEDHVHRADRREVQRLNSRSSNGYAGDDHAAVSPGDQRAYDRARAEYRERLADWRRRVAACEAGRYDACQ